MSKVAGVVMRGDSEQGTLGSDAHIGSQGSLSRHASGNRMGRENRRSMGTHRAPQEGSHRLLIQGTSGRVGQSQRQQGDSAISKPCCLSTRKSQGPLVYWHEGQGNRRDHFSADWGWLECPPAPPHSPQKQKLGTAAGEFGKVVGAV